MNQRPANLVPNRLRLRQTLRRQKELQKFTLWSHHGANLYPAFSVFASHRHTRRSK